ncbi:MAG TPA: Fis family transcriptional regulator [Campylobacteraceae bacterium]|nr:Fis family transcriptional regulator [Campylobacteraceae bacterium]
MIKFIANSPQLQNITKSLELTKKFYVSSLLIGEKCSGRKTLARYILPNAPVVNGSDLPTLLEAVSEHEEVIITDFEKVSNYSLLNFDNKRVIATALYQPKDMTVDRLFGHIYEIPPLRERPEDAGALADIYMKNAREMLSFDEEIKMDHARLDLSQNNQSLKRQVFKRLILSTVDESDIEALLYDYFSENLRGDNDYKKYLHLYEKPLIKAGLAKYKSQLKLASILGINRNTLRKKVNEYGL